MPEFSAKSLSHLSECHPDLFRLFAAVVKHWDCQITDGARTVEEQEKNVAKGVSKTMDSKHLPQSDGYAWAVDVVPHPIDWTAVTKGLDAMRKVDPGLQTAEFYGFIGFVQGMAVAMGINIRSGADWDSDREFSEHSFVDLPHHELRR